MVVAIGQQTDSVVVRYRRGDGELIDSTLDYVPVDDIASGCPVREFRWYKGRKYYSGWYFASTNGRLVAYESRLELARIMLADFAPDVVGIASQPFQLTGRDGERLRRHVPDLLLVDACGIVTIVDVKPVSRLADPLVRGVFCWTERVVSVRGWKFEVWSGAEAGLLANVAFLAGYRRAALIDTEAVAAVLGAVTHGCTIGGLERSLFHTWEPRVVRPAVLHLLWRGRLAADLSNPLGSDTAVWAV